MGRYSKALRVLTWRRLNRALLVKRAEPEVDFFRNRGAETLEPLRFPATEEKKFLYAASRSWRACCSGTLETSLSHSLSGVRLEAVNAALTTFDERCAPVAA